MPSERLGLRAWIEEKLHTGEFEVLRWFEREKGYFAISWKHASRHGWVESQDAALFKAWAIYTGRYVEGDKPDPKTWKANFRCAVNASSDISLVKGRGQCKGKNAHRVYAFSKKRKSKKYVASRTPGLKLYCIDQACKTNRIDKLYGKRYRTRPTRTRLDVKQEVEEEINVHSAPKYSHMDLQMKVKIEKDEDSFTTERICMERQQYGRSSETKLYSFRELIDHIPKLALSSSLSLPPDQTPPPTPEFSHAPLFYNQPPSLHEKLDEELIRRLAAEITINGTAAHEFDDMNDYFISSTKYADSVCSSDADMQEIFDDSKKFHSSSNEKWNETLIQKDEICETIHYNSFIDVLGSLNNRMTSRGHNDPFLGIGPQPSDMISALTQALTQELS